MGTFLSKYVGTKPNGPGVMVAVGYSGVFVVVGYSSEKNVFEAEKNSILIS